MEWWIIVLLALAGLGVLSGGFFGILRATRGLRQSLGTITSALNEAIAANNEPPKPRSLSSLESVAMPKILRDFPDFNAKVFSQRVRRDAETYYRSGKEGKVLFRNDATASFYESFEDRLPLDVKDEIKVHRVTIAAYDGSSRRKILTCQAAVGYIDRNDAQQERRLLLCYIAGYADDPESEVVGFNCPNCGAPLPAAGARVCVYCGTSFVAPVDRGWMLFDAKEG
jgi:hypothetical protein